MTNKKSETKEINYDFEISPDYDGTTGAHLLYSAIEYRKIEMEIIRTTASKSFPTAKKQIKKLRHLVDQLEKHQDVLDRFCVYRARLNT